MTSYYKACTKYFPVLLRTTKLAHSTSQYYFVPQCLHKVLPSTTSHYKACLHKKYFPVLLRTTKFAQKYFPVLLRTTTKLAKSTSQYYFVLRSSQKKHFSVLICLTKLSYKHFAILLRTKKLAKTLLRTNLSYTSLHKALPSTTSYYKARKTLPSTTSYYKACTKHFPVLLRSTQLLQSTYQYYCTKAHPSTTSHMPVLLRILHSLHKSTSKYYFVLESLHKSTSQYYFVLQSLHKVLPSTTSYHKACTNYFPVLLRTTKLAKHFPVLLRTTKLAQSTSQYYSVLRSFYKVLTSTTSYYKACTKYFPVLLRTTKLALSTSQYYFVPQSSQNTSQYYFVLQSLHKVLPSTTSHYKARKNRFAILLRTTKLAKSNSLY